MRRPETSSGHGGQRRRQFARMVRVIVHVDLSGGVDIEFEPALHARERRQRPAQGVRIQRNPFGPGRAPYRGHSRHRIFNVDPARNAQRAAFDHTARHYDVISVMASLEQLHVTGIEVARHVVRIAVHRNLRIVHHNVDPCLMTRNPPGAVSAARTAKKPPSPPRACRKYRGDRHRPR